MTAIICDDSYTTQEKYQHQLNTSTRHLLVHRISAKTSHEARRTRVEAIIIDRIFGLTLDHFIFAVIPLGWVLAGWVTSDMLKYCVAAGWVVACLLLRGVYISISWLASVLFRTSRLGWTRQNDSNVDYTV